MKGGRGDFLKAAHMNPRSGGKLEGLSECGKE